MDRGANRSRHQILQQSHRHQEATPWKNYRDCAHNLHGVSATRSHLWPHRQWDLLVVRSRRFRLQIQAMQAFGINHGSLPPWESNIFNLLHAPLHSRLQFHKHDRNYQTKHNHKGVTTTTKIDENSKVKYVSH